MSAKTAPGSYSEQKFDKTPVNTSGGGGMLKNGPAATPARPANMLEAMKRRASKSC